MLAIGTYLSIRLDAERFGACQVIGHDADFYFIAGIAYFGPKPTLDDLFGKPLLVIDHHHWKPCAQRLGASGEPSTAYEVIGVGEVGAGYDGPIHSTGSWDAHVASFRGQERWTHVPLDQARAFVEAGSAGFEKALLKLAGKEWSVTRSLSRVTVGSYRQPTTAGQTDWAALDRMGCLTRLDCTGPDTEVFDFVRRRRVISDFRWYGHAQRVIDLSDTSLLELTLDVMGGPIDLILGDRLEKLSLVGDAAGQVTVVHPRNGRDLSLTLERVRNWPVPINGLAELSSLSVSAPRELRLGSLGFDRLTELRLQCDRWLDPEALIKFPQLRSLECRYLYRLDATALPAKSQLPALASVKWEGVLEDAAAAIKKQLKGCKVSVSGAKDQAWVDATLGNPFHDWTYTQELLGKDASAAYGRTARALEKIAESDAKGFDKQMSAFAQSMAKLASAHDLDPQHKTQVRDAFHQLAATRGRLVDATEITAWLDRAGFP
jgi:hypothetical protein